MSNMGMVDPRVGGTMWLSTEVRIAKSLKSLGLAPLRGIRGGVAKTLDFFNPAQDAEDLGEMTYIYLFMTRELVSEEEARRARKREFERLKTLPGIQ